MIRISTSPLNINKLMRNVLVLYSDNKQIRSSENSGIKNQLITRSIPYIKKYGWSDNAIHAACAQLNLSPAAHRIIRPYDIIRYCMRLWNKNALRKIDDGNFGGRKRIRDKVEYSIQVRLMEELEFIDTWNQAMAIGAYPQNISQTKNLLWQYSDEVWRRCGDTSTDYNYYSKRILFNTAYATTELHLLTDQSPQKIESWKFLQRRIEDIMQFGKGINDLKTVGGAALDGILNLINIREPRQSQIKNPIKNYKLNEQNLNNSNSSQRVAISEQIKQKTQGQKNNSQIKTNSYKIDQS